MKKIILVLHLIFSIILILNVNTIFAQNRGNHGKHGYRHQKTDANIVGHVVSGDEHLPFVSIAIKGTTIGTTTDETGHFQLINLPPGKHIVAVSMIGYRPQEKKVTLEAKQTIEIKFKLEEDALNIEEIIVSADRSEQKRTEAPVIVNTLSPKIFNASASVTLGEGLNFSPGLRMENNCQNCGFSQVRMNGMEGAYSQILINSRPIFSGLAGVYGLELIPANMIEKVEVVRGGGSALFGSNAIAGTINIILKEPKANTYEAGTQTSLIGVGTDGLASDYSVNFNTTLVSDDHRSGASLYGFTRDREMYDANNDAFSEISKLKNLTFGGRAFHRFNNRDKLALDFFAIKEDRAGGNKSDYTMHERDISEAVTHDMKVIGLSYDCFFRDYDLLSVYASGQFLNRDSYYGANQSLSDYGKTRDNSYNAGFQYKANFSNSTLVAGLESTGGFLLDKKLGYLDIDNAVIENNKIVDIPHTENTIVANQSSITTGAFAQYEFKMDGFKIAAGGRLDHYEIKDLDDTSKTPKTGNAFSPRISIMYNVIGALQARVSYSQGYRAPQIFDEDLHIETSGSRKVLHVNDQNLTQETSHSYMASLDYNNLIGNVYTSILVEGFYTRLVDAFANEIGIPDETGTAIYTRINSEGEAAVQGVNIELRLKPSKTLSLSSGLTIQNSAFDEPQDFNETNFFRTPDNYGFFAIDWDFHKGFCFSTTGNYTGKMLVPYFGSDNLNGELRKSDPFFDLGAKLSYKVKLNGASVEFNGGIKNIFNSYQSDFDSKVDRDPAYVYGPLKPRTIFLGVKFGNIL
ncbi:MAG: TonB-dependent receptor [Prolixibacteraceae bacterium]|jgi:outer membrane receptor for ferrienterochelin and colicins|nr:TonB-dependent receptor [Prolixibacteraceae bacterium]